MNSVKDATGVGKSVAVAVVASSPAASPADPVPAPPDLKAPERLPNFEEELKALNAAITALRQPSVFLLTKNRQNMDLFGSSKYLIIAEADRDRSVLAQNQCVKIFNFSA